MEEKFEVLLLEEAKEFLKSLDRKTRKKITFNIRMAKRFNDPKLFKKLTDEIWEFRTRYQKKQYRLLAFWDKRKSQNTLVLATHGFVKKRDKVPRKEIRKAEKIREVYFKRTKGK